MNGEQRRLGPIGTVVRLRSAWRRLAPFFRGTASGLTLLIVLSVLTGLVEASLLALIATMAVSLAEGGGSLALDIGPLGLELERSTAFIVALGLALFRTALQLALARVPAQMSARMLSELRVQLFESFTASAWPVKARERDGAFQTLMTQNSTNTAGAVIHLGLGLTALIMFVVMTIAAFMQSAAAAAVFMVTAVVLFFTLRPLSRRLRRNAKQLSEQGMSFTNTVQEVVQVAEETEVFGATESYRAAFGEQAEAVRRPHARTRFLAVAVPALYQSVALILLVVSLIAMAVSGASQLAAMAAVILMLIRALTYAQQLQTSLASIDERIPYMNQLVDALERYRSSPQQSGTEDIGRIDHLALSQLSFAYTPGREVLHDVSFEVSRGQAVGIVGPSGAGKSSIVQILLRLREPGGGALLANGVDARTITRRDWQRKVAYVPQTSQVIWGTVRENIRFNREWISDEAVEAAARRAHIHDDIDSWPQGYDTVIGQRASAVSGGQRQRICLARALAGEPEVLILDEPTTALDVRSEELVQASLEGIKPDTIMVLVAHRLSTLSLCDWIVVVVDGRVSAVGSQADLKVRSDFFREVSEITARQAES